MLARIFLLLPLFAACFASKAFNEAFPEWPDYCCNLELTRHTIGNDLPSDAVIGGNVNGKRWGYAVDRHERYEVQAISETYDEGAVRLIPAIYMCDPAVGPEFEVLTNPNKCSINWYTTRYESEKFINSSGVSMRSNEVFMPAYDGFFFGSRNLTGGQWPATLYMGETSACYNHTGRHDSSYRYRSIDAGTKVLYVDCLKSLVTMSKGKLVNMTLNDKDIDGIRDSDVVYFKRTFINKSNETQKQAIAFSAEKVNTMFASISESYSSSKCDAQKSSFSEQFSTSVSTEVGVETSAWFVSISAKVGMEVSSAFQKMTEQSSSACSAQGKNMTQSSMHKEVRKYSFSDEITIPANSITTVTATSSPFRGQIPYTMTYELTPPANMGGALKRGLEYYKFGDRLEKTDRGSVLVHFNGAMVVDSGYEIVVDVTAVPVHEPESGFLMQSVQTVFPTS